MSEMLGLTEADKGIGNLLERLHFRPQNRNTSSNTRHTKDFVMMIQKLHELSTRI